MKFSKEIKCIKKYTKNPEQSQVNRKMFHEKYSHATTKPQGLIPCSYKKNAKCAKVRKESLVWK